MRGLMITLGIAAIILVSILAAYAAIQVGFGVQGVALIAFGYAFAAFIGWRLA